MNFCKHVIITGFIAGVLDITGACLASYFSKGLVPGTVLKYVASGVFGKAALEGGYGMMAWGLFFHFIIAYSCTVVFWGVYPKIDFLKKSIFINAVLIALTAWAVTNLIIIPLSRIGMPKFTISSVTRAVTVLILCIGLPISYGTKKYYHKQKKHET